MGWIRSKAFDKDGAASERYYVVYKGQDVSCDGTDADCLAALERARDEFEAPVEGEGGGMAPAGAGGGSTGGGSTGGGSTGGGSTGGGSTGGTDAT